MLRRLLLLPVLTLALVATLTAPASAAMTDQQAGQHYLAAVCPINATGQRLHQVLFGKKKFIRAKDVKRKKKLKRVRAALRQYDAALFNGATSLRNPPDTWPDYAAEYAVDDYARWSLYESDAVNDLLYARGQEFIDIYAEDYAPYSDLAADASRRARSELGLPPPGQGC